MKDTILTILGAGASIYALLAIGIPIYERWGIGKRFYHNILGWHKPKDTSYSVSQCTLCGREIYQDMLGNWIAD